MHEWMNGHWGHMAGRWTFWILVLLLVVGFAVWLARRTASGGQTSAKTSSAEDILRERFARGEIDENEYRKRLDELRAQG